MKTLEQINGSVSPCGSVSPQADIMTKEEAEDMFLYVYGKELFLKLEGRNDTRVKNFVWSGGQCLKELPKKLGKNRKRDITQKLGR